MAKWLIVGLGNPGAQYSGTRHNVGFEVIELLAKEGGIRLNVRKHRAVYGRGTLAGQELVLCKPLTYMNVSGQAVAPVMRENFIEPCRVLVIADDLDLPLGTVRLRASGGAGGHNGHRSIISSLGTQEYPRIRIGIGKPDRQETVDHVLSRFTKQEAGTIDSALERAMEMVHAVLERGVESAMTDFNGKPL